MGVAKSWVEGKNEQYPVEQSESGGVADLVSVDNSLVFVSFEMGKNHLLPVVRTRSFFPNRVETSASRARSRVEEDKHIFLC